MDLRHGTRADQHSAPSHQDQASGVPDSTWKGRLDEHGIADEAKGKLKETAGSVTSSDDLREEGQAQQHKGRQEEKAAEARATAERHEQQAESAERVEQKHQGA